jgi:hypothetical protein
MALYYVLSKVLVESAGAAKQYLPGDTVDSASTAYTLLHGLGAGLWPVSDTVFAAAMVLVTHARSRGADESELASLVAGAIATSLADLISQGTQPGLTNFIATFAAADTQGFSVPYVLTKHLAASGATGTADAPQVLAASEYGLLILDVTMNVSVAGAGATTATLSSANTAGTLYTNAMSTAAQGMVRSNVTTVPGAVAKTTGTLYLQRTDRSAVVDLTILCIRTS